MLVWVILLFFIGCNTTKSIYIPELRENIDVVGNINSPIHEQRKVYQNAKFTFKVLGDIKSGPYTGKLNYGLSNNSLEHAKTIFYNAPSICRNFICIITNINNKAISLEHKKELAITHYGYNRVSNFFENSNEIPKAFTNLYYERQKRKELELKIASCPSKPPFNNCFGTFTWTNGDRYIGDWKENIRHGQGTYTWANGNKYVGEWQDNKKHGQGTITWEKSGSKYVGEHKDDKRNGEGTFTWANGDKYLGEYKNGNRTGEGIFSFANGKIQEGI
ncbi:hypothetical protein OAD33_08900, partial [Alphaproteobacteria bacterium]|nr:hypothetical protein [Alphaproteobacteria bacterium]